MKNFCKYFFLILVCLSVGSIVFFGITKIKHAELHPIFNEKNILTDTVSYVELGKEKVFVDIADTQELRIKGLSGRDSLAAGHGMFFLFPETGYPAFWMKDMKFPIDIIWIHDGKIVDITPHAFRQPGDRDQDLKIYIPREKVNFVLEVVSGFAEDHDLHIGDSVHVVTSIERRPL